MVSTPDPVFSGKNRSNDDQIKEQQHILHDVPMLEILLNAIPVAVLVLNGNRQIIFGNVAFLEMLERIGSQDALGKKFGEVFHCINASEGPGGCGTSEFCWTCGAMTSLFKPRTDEKFSHMEECRIMTSVDADINQLDLRIWTTPFHHHGQGFTILTVMDISGEKRLGALEQIFFHDILNLSGAALGLAEVLALESRGSQDNKPKLLLEINERVVEEIKAQRDLLAAERGHLQPEMKDTNTLSIISSLVGFYLTHGSARGKKINVAAGTDNITFRTDPVLLGRVLGNMLKNALEASKKEETVTIGSSQENDRILFWVHNEAHIPSRYHHEIFKRSFSTKGINRGLGTYSMKLIAEQYLAGQTSFSSSEKEGTRFEVRLPYYPR